MAASAAAVRRGRIPAVFLASLVFFYLAYRAAGKRFHSQPVDHNNGLSGDARTAGQVGLPLLTERDGRMMLDASEKSDGTTDTAEPPPPPLVPSPPPPPPQSKSPPPPSKSHPPPSKSPPPPSKSSPPPPIEDSPLPGDKSSDSSDQGGAGTGKDQAAEGRVDEKNFQPCSDDSLSYKIEQGGSVDQIWSLTLKYTGGKPVDVSIEAPPYLEALPNRSKLEKDEDTLLVKLQLRDGEKLKPSSNDLVIKLGEDNSCNFSVPHEGPDVPSGTDLFSSFGALTGSTKVVGGGLVVLVLLVATCSCICYRCKTRKQRHGLGAKYEEVEMSAPKVDLSTAFSQETSADGWDEVWDDEDWEDTEAARSSARSLVPSLSAKGLNSRRTSKDGWDTWEP